MMRKLFAFYYNFSITRRKCQERQEMHKDSNLFNVIILLTKSAFDRHLLSIELYFLSPLMHIICMKRICKIQYLSPHISFLYISILLLLFSFYIGENWDHCIVREAGIWNKIAYFDFLRPLRET